MSCDAQGTERNADGLPVSCAGNGNDEIRNQTYRCVQARGGESIRKEAGVHSHAEDKANLAVDNKIDRTNRAIAQKFALRYVWHAESRQEGGHKKGGRAAVGLQRDVLGVGGEAPAAAANLGCGISSAAAWKSDANGKYM